jgi:hypothetical protein
MLADDRVGGLEPIVIHGARSVGFSQYSFCHSSLKGSSISSVHTLSTLIFPVFSFY